jgi:hypothetical protein
VIRANKPPDPLSEKVILEEIKQFREARQAGAIITHKNGFRQRREWAEPMTQVEATLLLTLAIIRSRR